MKSIHLLSFLSIWLLSGCIKDEVTLQNALPIVETVSATKLSGNRLALTGNVQRAGAAPLDILGFCYHKSRPPLLTDNQIDINPKTGQFSAVLENIFPLDTIYFNTYAGNQYGYTTGNPLQYIVENNAPPVIPCTVDSNAYYDGTFTVRNGYVYKSTNQAQWGKLAIIANFSTVDLRIEFNTLNPTNGVYTIGDMSTNDPTMCYVRTNNNVFDQGGKVYVKENGDGTYWVSFCDLSFNVGSFTVRTKANLKVY